MNTCWTILSIQIGVTVFIFLLHPDVLGQANGDNRSLFEEGLISTSVVEYGCSFSSDGKEVYFVRSEDPWGSPNSKGTIYYSKKEKNGWTTPEVAFFSGVYDDSDPHLSVDGRRLFFISKGRGEPGSDSPDIWVIDKSEEGSWGKARRLAEPLNSTAREYSPRTDKSGNLYFASDRSGGLGQGDLYVSRREKGSYQDPENMGNGINSVTGEWNLEISDQGDILIFEASGRTENKSSYGDLYISFKKGNVWSIPQIINELNTTGSDLSPDLMSQNKILFYSSSNTLESQSTNIYEVPFESLLEKYRNNAVFTE